MQTVTLNNFNMYLIYEDGRIFSKQSNKFLKITYDKNVKYNRISLINDFGEKKKFLVHRLVAEAFIPNPENKPEVNHIDGDKTNNHVSNLEWVTRSENMQHAFKTGLNSNIGINNSRSLLTEREVIEIYCKLLEGSRGCDLAKEYNVSRPTISDIKARRNWQDILGDYPACNVKQKQKSLSEETVRWICSELKNGTRVCDILKKSTNKNLTEDQVFHIKLKKSFIKISNEYF